MRLYERYRPERLEDVLGQSAVTALQQFACEPYPNILIMEGDSGTGKTCAAMILSELLGCQDWFGSSVYKINGADLTVDAARSWFDPNTSPFRYRLGDKWHVLRIEELEWVSPACQRYLKEALEEVQRRYRVIVIATSNDASKLVLPLRHRFKPFTFTSGPSFADAINNWLPMIWYTELGQAIDLPYGYDTFGWYTEDGREKFSARLALNRLEHYLALERAERMVAA